MSKRVSLAAAIALALSLLLPAPHAEAQAPPSARGNYCVLHVTGQKASGELIVSAPACYDTSAEAVSREHIGAWGQDAAAKAATLGVASFTIGTHCDGFNGGAPCTLVSGDNCNGGWLNVSSTWNNRISSTTNGCPTVTHFDGANLTLSSESTVGSGTHNLSTLNNKATSIQYS